MSTIHIKITSENVRDFVRELFRAKIAGSGTGPLHDLAQDAEAAMRGIRKIIERVSGESERALEDALGRMRAMVDERDARIDEILEQQRQRDATAPEQLIADLKLLGHWAEVLDDHPFVSEDEMRAHVNDVRAARNRLADALAKLRKHASE